MVREQISRKDDKFKEYYVEQVLEKDVKETWLNPMYWYEEETTDMIVLLKEKMSRGETVADYRISSSTFIASIDLKTNELNQSWGTVVRIEKNTKLKFKYKFKGMEAYHIKARRNKDISNLYMVKDVLKKVTDDRLEKNKGRVQETGYY